MRARISGSSALRPDERIGGISPGCTEFTRMLSRPCCTAAALVKVRTAPFEALYPTWTWSWPVMPEIDEMLTIDPPPAAFMTGIANFMPRKTPRALTAISRSHAAVSNRSSTALPESPASLTRMSSRLNSARVASTAARHSASFVTSRRRKIAAPFACVISPTTFLPSSSSISATATLAPSRAKIRAMLAPMPEAPPVISATLSSSLIRPLPWFALNDGDLVPQLPAEQVFRDHRVHAAYDIDDLRHAEASRDAAQRIGVGRGQFGADREKLDRIARRHRHRVVQILVEPHRDPVGRSLGDRPLEFLLLVQHNLDQHFLHAGFERGEADLAVALHGM